MAKKKKDTSVIMLRNTIIGFITLVAIGMIAFGTYVSTDLSDTAVTENEDYIELDNPRARRAGEPIEVIEFFSYACVHCKNFEPLLDEWLEDKPEDVTFRRQPTTFSPIYALLAQSYLTLEAADALDKNHNRIFRAIHDSGRQFLTKDMVADYVDGRDISRDEFIEIFDSPDVRQAMRRADREQREFSIASTPSLVVAGKYLVRMTIGGQRRALRVVDELVAKERAADAETSG